MNISDALKTITANPAVIRTIIAIFVLVSTIASGLAYGYGMVTEHLITREEASTEHLKQFASISRMFAQQQADYHELQVKIINIQLSHYDDLTLLSERERREKEHLESLLVIHTDETRRYREEVSKPDSWFTRGNDNPGGI